MSAAMEPRALSVAQARELTDQITTTLETAWELIVEAYQRRVWVPLGYGSWDSYCRAEFASARLRLPAEERRELTGSLREAGLSTRAIAAATGSSQPTVWRDLRAGDSSESPEPRPAGVSNETSAGGSPGESYDSPGCDQHKTSAPDPARVPVAGMDGKRYAARQPRTPDNEQSATVAAAGVTGGRRRRSLPDQARDAGFELLKAAERVGRITQDERLADNRRRVTLALRGHLVRVHSEIEAALELLDSESLDASTATDDTASGGTELPDTEQREELG